MPIAFGSSTLSDVVGEFMVQAFQAADRSAIVSALPVVELGVSIDIGHTDDNGYETYISVEVDMRRNRMTKVDTDGEVIASVPFDVFHASRAQATAAARRLLAAGPDTVVDAGAVERVASLRSGLIRLAASKPELRADILPLLKD